MEILLCGSRDEARMFHSMRAAVTGLVVAEVETVD
jgi:hypothetical protein